MTTSRFPNRSRRREPRPRVMTSSTHSTLAERNRSLPPPARICCARVEEAAKLRVTGTWLRASKRREISRTASRVLAAAKKTTGVEFPSRGPHADAAVATRTAAAVRKQVERVRSFMRRCAGLSRSGRRRRRPRTREVVAGRFDRTGSGGPPGDCGRAAWTPGRPGSRGRSSPPGP